MDRVCMLPLLAGKYKSKLYLKSKLNFLSKNDQDLSIRDAAIKALEKNYSKMEPITDE